LIVENLKMLRVMQRESAERMRTLLHATYTMVAALFVLVLSAPGQSATDRLDRNPQFRIKQWTMEQGLPQASVTSIAQSIDGYLWFGTYGGLVRFNGRDMEVIDVQSHPDLMSNRILSLCAAADGALWVGTEDRGVLRFADGLFEHIQLESGGPIWTIRESAEEVIWIGHHGLTCWEKGRVEFFGGAEEGPPPNILELHVVGKGQAWVGTGKHLLRFADGDLRQVSDSWTSAFIDHGDRGVLALGSKLRVLDFESAKVRTLEPNLIPSDVATAIIDSKGRDWIGAGSGLFVAEAGELDLAQSAALPKLTHVIGAVTEDKCHVVMEDREGNIWAGFDIGGLYRIQPREGVKVFSLGQGVQILAPDGEGRVIYGSGTTMRFELTSEGTARYSGAWPIERSEAGGVLFRDSRGALWFSMAGETVRRTADGMETWEGPASSITEAPDGHIWWASVRGIFEFDGSDVKHHELPTSHAYSPIHTLCVDSAGVAWFSRKPGELCRLKNGGLLSYGAMQGMPDVQLRSIVIDDEGTVWATTYGAGLVRVRDGLIKTITTERGLHDDSLGSIFEEAGSLWMNSNRGVFAVQLTDLERCMNGGADEVLTCWEVGTPEGNGSCGFRAEDGVLWFPTIEGMVSVTPSIRSNMIPPPILIESVAVNGVGYSGKEPLHIPAGALDLDIYYAGLSFVDPERVSYRTELIGEYETHKYSGQRAAAYFNNLSPGDYTFKVSARNNDGVWSENPATLLIHLEPHYYQTRWFAGLVVICIALALYGAHRLRMSGVNARNLALNDEIQAHKSTELALHERESSHRALAETATDGIVTVGSDSRLEYANATAEKMFELPDVTQGDCHLGDFLGAQGAATLDHLLTAGGRQGLLLEGRCASGRKFPVEVSSGEMQSANGDVRYVLILRDVTKRQELERQVAESGKLEAVGRLTGGVAHDFNNILTALIGHTAMLEDDIDDRRSPGALLSHTKQIRKSTTRAVHLVRQLMTFARRRVVDPGVVDPNAIIEDVESMLRRLVPEYAELKFDLCPDVGYVFVDAHELEQVLVNLVINGKDAIQGQGTITVATSLVESVLEAPSTGGRAIDGPAVAISVSDDGCGLEPEEMSKIFEPFYTTKEVGGGTGLGLASASGFAEQAGGQISVSTVLGEGSTFTIHLPAVSLGSLLLPRPEESSEAVQGKGGGTILLCDDEGTVLSATAAILRKAGYEVMTAGDPNIAADLFARDPLAIDALVTDMVMPIMNGRELARLLRETKPELRVLLMSGYTDNREEDRADSAEFLEKPFSPGQLIEAVGRMLAALAN
jgi:two-component system cell cycle sensor histidine kinase/response regulator CckA